MPTSIGRGSSGCRWTEGSQEPRQEAQRTGPTGTQSYPGRVRTAEQALLGCEDLDATIDFFVGRLGFRLDVIWPADDPSVAVLSRGPDVEVRLVRGSGSAVWPAAGAGAVALPAGSARFELTHPAETDTGVGRAGMHYRDLLPARQDGRFIASHILIPAGGEVPDYVHHHRVRFQLIYCVAGWVRVVYEDQGPPFLLEAGDCVLQPPGIRHRVLEASPGLEVVEIGCPAAHETFVEHTITLPTASLAPDRRWDEQAFVRHQTSSAAWHPWRGEAFDCRDTEIAAATDGLAAVRVLRPGPGAGAVELPPFEGDFLFWYVLAGTAMLYVDGQEPSALARGSAVALPASVNYGLSEVSPDLEALEVMLPA